MPLWKKPPKRITFLISKKKENHLLILKKEGRIAPHGGREKRSGQIYTGKKKKREFVRVTFQLRGREQ